MNIRLNLLHEERKREIRKKKNFYLVMWQGSLLVSFALAYMGVLAGIHLTLRMQLQDVERAGTAANGSFQEIGEYERLFKETNERVDRLAKFQSEHVAWSRLFMEMDRLVPDGVTVRKVLTKDYQVSLSGRASDRDTLLEFQAELNGSECFQNAQVPLSDLFSQKDVDFQMDVEMKKDCLKPKNL
jgi:Tfp pilus assembly protein PilN